jgi:plasmid stabilization system protein ParE
MYRVLITPSAEDDLLRLYDFIIERELKRPEPDFDLAERALAALRRGFESLAMSPFSCRKAGDSTFLRELLVPFGAAGYVVLFDITDASSVTVLAVRHQRESDYH